MTTKKIQGRLWSAAPQNWALYFEPWFLPMYKKALENLDLTYEHSLLDAGCGSGLFSYLAIKEGAQVIGVDAAPGLLKIARHRNPLNIFVEEDLESLPFPAHSFHVVTGFNSFQYAGTFERALEEAERVLKPGGRLVIGVWDKPELNDATHVLTAIGELLAPPPAGESGPFSLSEEGMLEKVLEKKGLTLIYKTIVPCPFLYASLHDGINSFLGTSPAAAAIEKYGRPVVKKTIALALNPFRLPEGLYFLQNQFRLFITEK
jgi:ubiquinone/menaquinone biosynthesis C-methylase UbiE